jgi:hypothetical protein
VLAPRASDLGARGARGACGSSADAGVPVLQVLVLCKPARVHELALAKVVRSYAYFPAEEAFVSSLSSSRPSSSDAIRSKHMNVIACKPSTSVSQHVLVSGPLLLIRCVLQPPRVRTRNPHVLVHGTQKQKKTKKNKTKRFPQQ